MSNAEYLKRYNAPKSWLIDRKEYRLISKPNPGPHPLARGISLGLILKQLGFGQTANEVRKILNTKQVLVDGRKVSEPRHPVGLFDTIEIPDVKKAFQITIDLKGRLTVRPAENAKQKACKIVGKTVVRGGKLQVNLIDGRNILTNDKVNVGDTLVLELPSQKIVKHLKLDKGASILLTSGRFVGNTAKVDNVEADKVQFSIDKTKSETQKQHTYVIA